MTPSSLSQTVDLWTAEVMVASGYLVRLYRILGDDRQAFMAVQAQGPCAERVQRLGLQSRIADLQAVFIAGIPQETAGEQQAWELLIEAQAGLCAFHGMANDHEKSGSLRGSRTGTTRAFHKSLLGYRTAFPEEMTIPGIQLAIETAASRCAEAFSLDVDGATDQEKAEVREELRINILDALTKEAMVIQNQS